MFPVDLELLRKNPEKFREAFRKRFMEDQLWMIDKALELDNKRISLQKERDSLRSKLNKISKVIGALQMYSSGRSSKEETISYLSKFVDNPEEYLNKSVGDLKEEISSLKNKIEAVENELESVEKELVELLWKFPNFVADDSPLGPDDSYNVPIKFWGIPRVWKEYLSEFKEQTEKYGFKVVEVRNILNNEEYSRYIRNRRLLEEAYKSLRGEEVYVVPNYNDLLDFEKLNEDKIVPYVLVDWEPKHHYDLVREYNIADTDKAGEVAGSRFYYEKDKLVILDLALGLFALKKLFAKGYKPVIPPYMLKGWVINGVLDIDTFEDMIYKIEEEDLYLIGTAEHPLTALHANEILDEESLPLKYVGWSPCFRKEAGSHGKDTKGIFRVHQFHKVEQYVFCEPEESEELHREIISNAEEILQDLNIPYRIVNIATGDLGAPAYKKYDIEGWFPGQGKYRELVSGSNVLDWQARRMNIRMRRKDGKLEPVHTLNSTALAHQRVICAILENYYDPKTETIAMPDMLVPLLGFERIHRPSTNPI